MLRDPNGTLTRKPFAGWLPTIYETGDRLAELMDRHKYILLAVFSITYFADVLYRASRKLFWFDELLTVYAARLETVESLWKGLMAGIDFNPPLFHIVTRLSERVLGESTIGARLPEIVGFWIFCLCLFRFVSPRSTSLSGFIALLFPVASLAHWYAYDARPYGMALGLCGIALVCWQEAADRSTGRFWYLAGMGVALACILLMHTNSFLIFAPLAAGEVVRAIRRRRAD